MRQPPHSYLLRLWREDETAPLRATLIDVTQPNAAQHFASLAALYAYLRKLADETLDTTDQQNEADDTHTKPIEKEHHQ